jgi:hypothetical protein
MIVLASHLSHAHERTDISEVFHGQPFDASDVVEDY